MSLAEVKAWRRPGRVSHVMRAAADVTDSVNTLHTHGIQLAIACSRDVTETRQTPEERQVLPIQHPSI